MILFSELLEGFSLSTHAILQILFIDERYLGNSSMLPGVSPSALYFHHAFSYATIIVLSRLAGPQGERDRLKRMGPKSDFVSLGSPSPSQHSEMFIQ